MKTTFPLSGRGKQINYEYVKDGFDVTWGKSPFHIPNFLIDDIMKNFFIDKNEWYPLGADPKNSMPKGLGYFIKSKRVKLNPRHACAVVAIMHNEKMIDFKDGSPMLLKKL
ncbi:MAG: hypothetical protein ACYDIA_07075 [Candidatus Humimicrobiaceae bacterium]